VRCKDEIWGAKAPAAAVEPPLQIADNPPQLTNFKGTADRQNAMFFG